MFSSLENALLLLHKWADSSAVIKLWFEDVGWKFEMNGRFTEVSDARAVLKGDTSSFCFRLEDCVFEYREPRETPAKIREDAGLLIVCALSVRLPTMASVILYELKPE